MVFLLFSLVELFLLFLLSRAVTQSLSALFFRITRSEQATVQLLAFLFLPGVIIHELAHLLTAGALLVRVGEIEFMPKVQGKSVRLGSVEVGKTDPIRRAIIGVAPVLLGLAIMLGGLFYITNPSFFPQLSFVLKIIVASYIIFQIVNTMFSSKKDVEGLIEFLAVIFILILIAYLLGFRLPLFVLSFFHSEAFSQFFQQASVFLLVPLFINIGVLSLTKVLTKR